MVLILMEMSLFSLCLREISNALFRTHLILKVPNDSTKESVGVKNSASERRKK